MQRNILIVFGILAMCMMQSANAISCYQCKSLKDANCAKEHIDKETNIPMIDCNLAKPPTEIGKYKPVTKCNTVITKDAAGPMTYRDCHFEAETHNGPDVCLDSYRGEIVTCKTCSGNLCNNAGSEKFLALTALFAMVSMYFVM